MTARTPLRPGDPLPEGWRWVRLGEVAKAVGGGTPSKKRPEFYQGTIPWVTVSDLGESLWIEDARAHITEEAIQKSSTKLLPSNAVLFATRVSVGKVAISKRPLCTNQDFRSFICGPEISPVYLAHYLRFKAHELVKSARGATVKGITSKLLDNLELVLPPLETQRRIVAWLDEAFSHLQAIKERHAEAEREAAALLPAKLAEVFSRAEKEGWRWVRLGEVASINPRTLAPKEWGEEKLVPFVEMASLDAQTARVVRFELKPYGAVSKGKTRFQPGDILFAKITPSVENGKVGTSDNVPGPLAFGSTEFHVIRPGPRLNKRFILYFLKLPSTRQAAVKSMVGATGRRRVPLEFLKSLELPLPPLETQRRIVEEIEAFEEEARRIQKAQEESRAVLEQLEKSVLAEAFRPERWV